MYLRTLSVSRTADKILCSFKTFSECEFVCFYGRTTLNIKKLLSFSEYLEGLDASQVLLRSRGRPSHSYLDSPLIQSVLYHQANGTQSLEKLAVIGSNGSLPAAVGDAVGDAAALQFSVEIAAINQAIMSLTGQKPISVKTEKADISEYASSSCMAAAAAATTTVTADMS